MCFKEVKEVVTGVCHLLYSDFSHFCSCGPSSLQTMFSCHTICMWSFFKLTLCCCLSQPHLYFLLADLPDLETVMFGLCCHGDKRLVWKAIYFECLSTGKHFLEQVLVGANQGQNKWMCEIGLHDILHAIVMRISSVKTVLWRRTSYSIHAQNRRCIACDSERDIV